MINRSIEEKQAVYIPVKDFAKSNNLEIFYSPENHVMTIQSVMVNRPGLMLAGFADYFANSRLQVIGSAEIAFLNTMPYELMQERIAHFLDMRIPGVILARGFIPHENQLKLARERGIPVFGSNEATSECVNNIMQYLNDALAPTCELHGVLIDISGLGVLLTGKNGIGKSETALELIHHGHTLIADDVVIVKRIKNSLYGRAHEKLHGLLEVRGVGIINVEDIFGLSSVMDQKVINFVVNLKEWSEDFDRLGNENLKENILGLEIPKIEIPVIAGRNLAVVIEAAAKHMRLKLGGHDPLVSLLKGLNN